MLASFFKTGKGEYGEGDVFLGITVPDQRRIARDARSLSLAGIRALLMSKVHEHRLTALLILVEQFRVAAAAGQGKIADFYLSHTDRINNWDLVDVTAPHILGVYLLDRKRTLLYRLARSPMLWERRIAILATFAFIRENDFSDTLRIAKNLLSDNHDLIHKAVGWMLREVGKREPETAETFLEAHAARMPRTMLRYAIERFPQRRRAYYLKKKNTHAGPVPEEYNGAVRISRNPPSGG